MGIDLVRPAWTERRRWLVFGWCLCIHTTLAWAQEPVIAIKAARVIDGVRALAIDDGVVIVRKDRVESIGRAGQVQIPASATVVDLEGHTVLPGLIDSHEHPTVRPDEDGAPAARIAWAEPDGIQMARAVRNMRVSLLSGITTVRSLGESRGNDLILADAIRDGIIPAPRVIYSGPAIAPSGGHGAPLWWVDGADNIRRRVRQNVLAGAQVIKLLLIDTSPTTTAMTREEVEAAVDEAHRLGVRVVAHTTGNWGAAIRLALACGVDGLEHVRPLNDEMIELFVEHGTTLNITTSVYIPNGIRWSRALWHRLDTEIRNAEEWIGLNRSTILQARREDPLINTQDRSYALADHPGRSRTDYIPGIQPYQAQLLKAHERGVPISVGTDGMHALLQLEIEYLVEAGFTPMAAIQAATRVAARGLGLEDRLGTLEPGKLADIIAVEGDPLERIQDLAKVRFVMVGGRRYDHLSFH